MRILNRFFELLFEYVKYKNVLRLRYEDAKFKYKVAYDEFLHDKFGVIQRKP